jgi:hypothetical protein
VLAALLIAAVLDFGMGLLLISVSGFILQGVGNTGPMMPEAVFFVLMIALCLGLPAATWFLRRRLAPLAVLAIAYSPLIVAGLVLLAGPMFA